jgi:hypothetical protein
MCGVVLSQTTLVCVVAHAQTGLFHGSQVIDVNVCSVGVQPHECEGQVCGAAESAVLGRNLLCDCIKVDMERW